MRFRRKVELFVGHGCGTATYVGEIVVKGMHLTRRPSTTHRMIQPFDFPLGIVRHVCREKFEQLGCSFFVMKAGLARLRTSFLHVRPKEVLSTG